MGEPLARDSPTGAGQCAVVFDGVLVRDSSDALSEEDLADTECARPGGVSASAVIPGGQIPVLDLEDDDAAFRVEEDEIGAEPVEVGLDVDGPSRVQFGVQPIEDATFARGKGSAQPVELGDRGRADSRHRGGVARPGRRAA